MSLTAAVTLMRIIMEDQAMNRPQMREPTDQERGYIAALIRRGGEAAIAQLLGASDGTLRSWRAKDRWPVPMLEKAMLLTLDTIPKKTVKPRFKPTSAARQATFTRSELLHYRED